MELQALGNSRLQIDERGSEAGDLVETLVDHVFQLLGVLRLVFEHGAVNVPQGWCPIDRVRRSKGDVHFCYACGEAG
jgi:hypothetical protein